MKRIKKWKIEIELHELPGILNPLDEVNIKRHLRYVLEELEADLDIVPSKFKNLQVKRIKWEKVK